MTWVAVAVAGAAVVGAAASNNAANKSADAAKQGLKSSNALASQSRADALNLFGQGRSSAQQGIGNTLDFYKGTAQQQVQPLIQGNMLAQQATGQGGIQANNAILGLPVDMSFANNPQQVTADYSAINSARLPVLGANYTGDVNAAPQAQNIQNQSAIDKAGAAVGFGGGGPFQSLTDKRRFDVVELGKNPLGLNDSNYQKIQPKNVTKKIKKILGF